MKFDYPDGSGGWGTCGPNHVEGATMTGNDDGRAERIPALNRRGFVRLSVITLGTVALGTAGVSTSQAATKSLSEAETTALLALSRAVATAPAPLPSFEEAGTPLSRVTQARLADRLALLASSRRVQVHRGLNVLTPLVASAADQSTLIAGIGAAVRRDAHAKTELVPVTALAHSIVTSHFSPIDDAAAELWLNFSAHYAQRLAR
ncbi:hypothetical protein [Amycolatopsis sp. NPDC001319]|uniref:hypothetical protein n=1 Tax=unclassified Amycolatopsis TaxID=2618356 RepID=UPI003679831B